MPSRIVSSEPAGAEPREWWIEKPFLTIGGGETDDIRLAIPNLAVGAVCLQFRDGGFEVFNKSSAGVAVDGTTLPVGGRVPLRPSGAITWDGGTTLRLLVEGNPAPVSRPMPRAGGSQPQRAESAARPTPAESVAASPPAGPGLVTRLVQFTVIGACAAVVALMGMNLDSAGGAPAVGSVGFESVISAVDGLSADTPRRLARRLRDAEAAFRRRDKARAGEQYVRLRRYIADEGGLRDKEVDGLLLGLVEDRLAAIARWPDA